MGAGLFIDYLDGTRPIEVTAGMQVPSWLATVAEAYSGATLTIPLPGRIQGSTLMVIPTSTAQLYRNSTIAYFTGFVDNGSSVTLQMTSTSGGNVTDASPAVSVYQTPPAGMSAGLLIQDAPNFTLITAAQSCCRVLFQGRITFNGNWAIPAYEGIDPEKMIIAAHWSAPDVAVARTSAYNNKLKISTPRITAYAQGQQEDWHPRDITMDIIVYGPGFPDAGNAGMAIWNANGNCVFSTSKRPFVVKSRWAKSQSASDVDGMIVLDMPGYWVWKSGSGVKFQRMGYVRNGLSLSVQAGEYVTGIYAVSDRSIISSISTLILPPLY